VPATTCSGGTPRRSATAATTPEAKASGYRLTRATASSITFVTLGSGGYGFSFDEILYATAPPCGSAGRPGR
jgi:hypothetical protein